ncbi:alpha/beta fold hydrolase [Pseudonocardia alni]|uniref:Pimeloyl-ACP methyl ester carboxylesterase n=1 Tax=Pseudonocardia alni TaxID=33907 RepID=A0AA44ZS10_PSEA5|nr:alpha/beta hydrolase [Pseudonocardia alni]PKB33429.1 pimeloyl-ACP methyl ester carboxylesterase [Pseudonocardia alni]
MLDVTDHAGTPVTHGRKTVNGVRLHYVTAGSGPALVLLHGVPKTWYYWHRVIPLLTEHFTVIAPDVRGFGDSERPEGGYDMGTIAEDVGALLTELGHETFAVAGEDWGAAFAYAVAATFPERVTKLSYGEMLLPGFGLEDWSALTADNVRSSHFLWHVGFFHVPDFPEMLISGREEIFWSTWMKNETYNPAAITPDCVAEWTRCSSAPGGLRAIFEVYRATFTNIALDEEWGRTKLPMPVLAVASELFIGEETRRQMERVSDDVRYVEIAECGHSMALEQPAELAGVLREFFAA